MWSLEPDSILLSRFVLRRRLSEGGMGQVWLAHDQEIETAVALKVLHPRLAADAGRVTLFRNEYRNMRRLVHPNIVRVFDFHYAADEMAFIAMEYVDGEDLAAYQHGVGMLSSPDMVARLRPVTEALSYAHRLGIVHRDVKASNILLHRNGTPRLADFGIASLLSTSPDALVINTGGSLSCMSPQQLDGDAPQASDDIYALGVLMYELLTGHPPFYPDITPEKIRRQAPPSVNRQLAALNASTPIPDTLDTLITNMLAKTPAERPASMEAVNTILQDVEARLLTHTEPPALSSCDHTDPPSIDHAFETRQDRTDPPDRVYHPASAQTEVGKRDRLDIISAVRSHEDHTHAKHSVASRRHRLQLVAILGILVVIVGGGGMLLQYLSKNPVQLTEELPEKPVIETPATEDQPELMPAKPPVPESETDATQLAVAKTGAENELAAFLPAQKALTDKGAASWGGARYAEMMRLSREADARFVAKDYTAAATTYNQARSIAQALASEADKVFQRLLDEGRAALVEGNSELAQHNFNLALQIDPTHTMARRNLERANNLETVLRLLESGQRHEATGELALARPDYEESVRLDPESKTARTALQRVRRKQREARFQQLMSTGLAASHEQDYDRALAALRDAQALKPDAREPKEALAQVEQAMRLARITSLQQKARSAEQAEDWEQAVQWHQGVLDIDAAVQFAIHGKERAMQRLKLVKHMQWYLDKPHVLETDEHLDKASQLLIRAQQIESRGPRLTELISRLDRLVIMAQTPVHITLESDQLTEVAVYQVGKLGRFDTKDLQLRPGTYTLVGTRSGYKDVRHQLVVQAGKPLRVSVKCREKI